MGAEERQRQQIEAEVRRPGYRGAFEVIQAAVPGWEQLGDWRQVWRHVDELRLDAVALDVLVATALGRLTGPDRPCWQAILLRALWSPLLRAARRRRRWDIDQDELWQALLFCLLDSARRVRMDTPVRSIARKLVNAATHRLHDTYRRRWDHQAHEHLADDTLLIELAGARLDPEYDRVDARLDRRRHLKQLRAYREAGRLGATDTLILIATDVYGVSLRRFASRAGSPYERVKKRRQRARKKLERLDQIDVPTRTGEGPL